MGKVDFSNIPFRQEAVKGMTYEEWLEKLKKETGKTPEDLYNHTMEQIDIRPPVSARAVPHHVCDPALDRPAVRRLLHRRGE